MAPVRIIIPALGLDVPVVEVAWSVARDDDLWRTEWETADHAAGHLRGSALPGEMGNMVIAGHHNTRGEVFRQLSDVGLPGNPLRQGDTIVIVADNGVEFSYRVVAWYRFLESGASPEEMRQHARFLEQTDTSTLTLVTCWPYETNTHRVITVAQLVH
ncbi:MAG TPA: sortase [Anaerolineae bacterium]|nr:sortase [Anaerolineae bacterium]